jgi:cobalamin biosynthesis protein CbiG
MHYCVVYFTRTNTSKRVAEKLAAYLHCPVVQITDHKNWSGLFGYIKAGFYSTVKKPVHIELLGECVEPDEYIVVTPLWAGGIAPAGVAFLNTVPREKVHLVVCSLGSVVEDRQGFKSVSDVIVNAKNEESVVNGLIQQLSTS